MQTPKQRQNVKSPNSSPLASSLTLEKTSKSPTSPSLHQEKAKDYQEGLNYLNQIRDLKKSDKTPTKNVKLIKLYNTAGKRRVFWVNRWPSSICKKWLFKRSNWLFLISVGSSSCFELPIICSISNRTKASIQFAVFFNESTVHLLAFKVCFRRRQEKILLATPEPLRLEQKFWILGKSN